MARADRRKGGEEKIWTVVSPAEPTVTHWPIFLKERQAPERFGTVAQCRASSEAEKPPVKEGTSGDCEVK